MKRMHFVVRTRALVWLLTGAIFAISVSQTLAQTSNPSGQTKEAAAQDPSGEKARLLVEELVSRNSTPKVENESPKLDAKFDWKEYDRTWIAFRSLASRGPEAWPDLVASLDDDRYCTTFKSISGVLRQWNVSHVSREIIGRNLAAAYYQLLPESPLIYHRLAIPDVARDRKALKAWCEKRSDRKLYELQIETCEWAISALSDPDDFERVGAEAKQKWIAAIKGQIEQLRTTKQAVPFRGFGPEEFAPFSEKKPIPFNPAPK